MSSSDDRHIWISRHVIRHEPALRAWLTRRTVSGLDVDDVIQETYARLAAVESVDGIVNARNYMFQTAQSVIVSHVRRARIVSFQTVSDVDQLRLDDLAASPETQVIDRDELRRLSEALGRLPDKLRQVVVMRRLRDMSQKEVARALRLPETTIEKRMSRGLEQLMRLFMTRAADPGDRRAAPDARRRTGRRD
jgi:RNA polymerase sigma-70 factor (ECF subfamily)